MPLRYQRVDGSSSPLRDSKTFSKSPSQAFFTAPELPYTHDQNKCTYIIGKQLFISLNLIYFILLSDCHIFDDLITMHKNINIWISRHSHQENKVSLPFDRSALIMGMKYISLILLLMLPCRPGWGAEVLTLEVKENDGRYTIRFDAVIDAPREQTLKLLLSPPHWPKLSRMITDAKVLESTPLGPGKVSVTFRDCVLFFCTTVRRVETVAVTGDGHIDTMGIPDQSDFSHSHEHWHIYTDNGRTRVRYDAELVPDFFVPPLIGPYILKSKLSRSLMRTAVKLEQLANLR